MLDTLFASGAHAEINPDFVELVFAHRGQTMKILMRRDVFNQLMSSAAMAIGFEWLKMPDKNKEEQNG